MHAADMDSITGIRICERKLMHHLPKYADDLFVSHLFRVVYVLALY